MTTYTFTATGQFTADSRQDAWDMWVEWLREPSNLEAFTATTVEPETADLITIYHDDANFRETQWAVIGDLRRTNDDYAEANYLAEKALKPQFPNIEFDPEMSCFYAYAASEADAQALVEAIKEWRG